jgi:hypothetical protein
MYTLRQVEIHPRWGKQDYFVKNLSSDLAKAQAKAKAYTGMTEDLEVREVATRERAKPREVNHRIIIHGKYKGWSVSEVAESDPEWLSFILDNCSVSRQQRAFIEENSNFKAFIERKREEERKRLEARAEKERKWEEAKQAKRDNSEHMGTVGVRQAFEATVTALRFGEGAYGYWQMTELVTDDGNVLQYWNSVNPKGKDSAEKGDRVRFMAGVKKHDSYDGIAQTVLTRVTKAEILHRADPETAERDGWK